MAGLPQALFDATEAQKAAAKAEERAANASVIGAKAAQLQRELHVDLRDRRGSFGNRVRVFCLLRILPFDPDSMSALSLRVKPLSILAKTKR